MSVHDQDVMPSSLEAEAALLGDILHDNKTLTKVRHFLNADYFYSQVHVQVYTAILAIVDGGGVADPIVLKNRLSENATLSEMGGVEYLADLVASAPKQSVVAVEYAKMIADFAMRREAIRIVSDARSSFSDTESDTVKPEIANVLDRLARMERMGAGQQNFLKPQSALEEFYATEAPASVSTGWAKLDRVAKFDRGGVTILAGLTSMGKSAFAVETARLAASRGDGVKVFSLEMKAFQIAARMTSAVMASEGGEQLHPARGLTYRSIIRKEALDSQARDLVLDAAKYMPDMDIDEDRGLTVSDIITRTYEGGVPDLLVVDYLSKISTADCPRDMRHDQKIGHIVNRLRDFAGATDCAVVLLVQLKRNGADQDTKVPSLEDLRDSGEIEQAADAVFFVHRPAYFLERQIDRSKAAGETIGREDQADLQACMRDFNVIVAKQRMGSLGMVPLEADIRHNYIIEGTRT